MLCANGKEEAEQSAGVYAWRNPDDLLQVTIDQDQSAGYQQVHQRQANNTGSFLFE